MNLTGAIVLYAVLWFVVLFVLLPLGQQSQADAGEVVPGTPPGAPHSPRLGRKMLWATVISALIWGGVLGHLQRRHHLCRRDRLGPPPPLNRVRGG